MSKNVSNKTYYYECPKPLGYLEITLDSTEKVLTAVFVDTKQKTIPLPSGISFALDQYFTKQKEIPKKLISKEIFGTVFQKSIWEVISTVEFGKTITYTDMAQEAGRPLATRAAGTACGKNPVALFIPCHRVVRKQGEDYGYSWGIERKKWLLKFEKGI
jgi:methylated-DNA-[protein]-cysteine S-methyltransferase